MSEIEIKSNEKEYMSNSAYRFQANQSQIIHAILNNNQETLNLILRKLKNQENIDFKLLDESMLFIILNKQRDENQISTGYEYYRNMILAANFLKDCIDTQNEEYMRYIIKQSRILTIISGFIINYTLENKLYESQFENYQELYKHALCKFTVDCIFYWSDEVKLKKSDEIRIGFSKVKAELVKHGISSFPELKYYKDLINTIIGPQKEIAAQMLSSIKQKPQSDIDFLETETPQKFNSSQLFSDKQHKNSNTKLNQQQEVSELYAKLVKSKIFENETSNRTFIQMSVEQQINQNSYNQILVPKNNDQFSYLNNFCSLSNKLDFRKNLINIQHHQTDFIVFQNQKLRINCSTNSHQQKEGQLVVSISFRQVTPVDLSDFYLEIGDERILITPIFKAREIWTQDLYFKIDQIPYQATTPLVTFQNYKKQQCKVKFSLPTLLTKFLEPRIINLQKFQKDWQSQKNLYYSEVVQFDQEILNQQELLANFFMTQCKIQLEESLGQDQQFNNVIKGDIKGAFQYQKAPWSFLIKIRIDQNIGMIELATFDQPQSPQQNMSESNIKKKQHLDQIKELPIFLLNIFTFIFSG